MSRRPAQLMLLPPLTLRIWPVMNRESSRARNATAAATSAASAPRPAGIRAIASPRTLPNRSGRAAGGQRRVELGGPDVRRRDHVDRDALAGELAGQAGGQAVHPALGRVVDGVVGQAVADRFGADADDPAVPALGEVRQHRQAHPQRGPQVVGDGGLQGLLGVRQGGGDHPAAGVVHADVDLPERAERRRDQGVGDAGADRSPAKPVTRPPGAASRSSAALTSASVSPANSSAHRRRAAGARCKADARRTAGDDGDPPLQRPGHRMMATSLAGRSAVMSRTTRLERIFSAVPSSTSR